MSAFTTKQYKEIVVEMLIGFVTRASMEAATRDEVAALPAVAKVLLDYLHSTTDSPGSGRL